jgi:hypothetical protein
MEYLMKKSGFLALWMIAVCTLFTGQLNAAQKYTFSISSKYNVGDRYKVFMKGKEHQVIVKTAAGSEPERKETQSEITLKAVCEILAVDNNGQEIKTKYAVEECSSTTDNTREDVIAAGSVLIVECSQDQAVFTLDGNPLPDEKVHLLKIVITNHEPNGNTDNEIMGIKEPVAVGQSWPIDMEILGKKMSKAQVIDPASVSGKSVLKGLVNHKGIKCYDVACEIKMDRLVSNQPDTTFDGSAVANYRILVPIRKNSTNPVFESLNMSMHVRMRKNTEDGEANEVEMSAEQTSESQYEPLDPIQTEGK